ncbi:uncharacterized protein LOC112880910 [Panicum hallii]|uniref:uncharacterized protein LOC112880910 n=1 Tax=Panicum hallii TaxID=206008 RepID=UPI000DF4D2E4|nr:uncharacterized protein LOC112880910 [Panicum hallii]
MLDLGREIHPVPVTSSEHGCFKKVPTATKADSGDLEGNFANKGIQELGQFASSRSREIAIVNQVIARKIDHEEKVRGEQACNTVVIIEDNQRFRKENEALESLRVLHEEKVTCLEMKVKEQDVLICRMSKAVDDNEKILENLRKSVETDANKISELNKCI